jgi:hypothetical protein
VRDVSQLAKLEVKLMTRQAEESEEVARIREVLSAQSEQILSLVAEKEVRCDRLDRLRPSRARPLEPLDSDPVPLDRSACVRRVAGAFFFTGDR